MGAASRAAALVASVVCAALLLASTLPSDQGSPVALEALEVADKAKVAKLLIDKGISKELICHKQTFAYCGSASCDVLSTDTAACGCKIYRDRTVKFKLSWTTGILLESVAFRRAVMAVVDGDDDEATRLICDAMDDGTLYSTSYGTSHGSVSLDEGRRLSASGGANASASVLNASATSDGDVKASCMGSPCTFESWDDDCGATCICAIEAEKSDVDSCLRNGVGSDYWTDLSSLMGVIGDMQALFTADGDVVASVRDAKRCRADCTVHHQS